MTFVFNLSMRDGVRIKTEPCPYGPRRAWCFFSVDMGEFMKKSIMLVAVLFSLSGFALAAGDNHTAEALKHAEHAVSHGSAGHAAQLVSHAENALGHAKQAEGGSAGASKDHVTAGIKALEQAIDHGNQDHADVATKHAEEAVSHFKAANQP